MTEVKGKIGVLIEEHFDEHNLAVSTSSSRRIATKWNTCPTCGISHSLASRGMTTPPKLRYRSKSIKLPTDYKGIILVGGYAMDRLRYQQHPRARST